MTKSGFVSIVGRPNVGKSTLLNKIIGEKLSIISDKPQTTRNTIQIIYTDERGQIVFVDTPGMQNPKNALGEYMQKVSIGAMDDMDLVVYMVDESDYIGAMDRKIIEELRKISTRILIVMNKSDKLDSEKIEELRNMYSNEQISGDLISVSAQNGDGVDELIEKIFSFLSEGPLYYPEDQITDVNERFVVSEIIREKALINLQEEIPHGICVEISSMKERKDKPIYDVEAVVYCEKESHKGIVIGKGGSMLKLIGEQARMDIEKLLDSKVNLKLWVKVEKNWRDKENKVKYFGYR